jgi:enterobacterial common antigen flippase
MASYKEILKTSGVVGGVKVITIIFSIIRTKAIALLLGTSGFGVFSLYSSASDFAVQLFSLGLNQSGVRQVAKSLTEDENKAFKTVQIMRKAIFFSSLVGILIMILFSGQISKSLFGSSDNWWGVVVISFVILILNISNGQIGILNGYRRIGDMSKSQIFGYILSAIVTIILIYFFKEKAIPLSITLSALVLLLTSSYYYKKLRVGKVVVSKEEMKYDLKDLLTLGLSLSGASTVFLLMSYFSRIFIRNEFGLDVVGIYQSSWNLSNMYVGIVLGAMGIDFLPRIMSHINDNKVLNKSVNEQIEFGLLIAVIGVIATYIFAPFILELFYSADFKIGSSIIRWQLLGVFLRVVAYPFGYVITGKGKGVLYLILQSGFYIVEFLLLVVCAKLWGLNGLGINYFVAYVLYFVLTGFTCFKLMNFVPSSFLLKLFGLGVSVILIAVLFVFFLKSYLLYLAGVCLIIGYSVIIYFVMKVKMDLNVISLIKTYISKK